MGEGLQQRSVSRKQITMGRRLNEMLKKILNSVKMWRVDCEFKVYSIGESETFQHGRKKCLPFLILTIQY